DPEPFPAADAHHRDWPLPPSIPAPTTPGTYRSRTAWPARSSSPQPLACLSPADLVPSRNFSPPALWLVGNAPPSTQSPALVRPAQSASAASPPDPSPSPVHPASASPLSETKPPCPCRTSAAGRTSPDNSTAASCSPRSNRCVRNAQTIGLSHRRSW